MDILILTVIHWAAIPVGLFALVHALLQRADAFPAVDKMTKFAWLGITAAGTAALALFNPNGGGMMFWIAGLVAVLVYIVDVKPRVTDVQRGQRW